MYCWPYGQGNQTWGGIYLIENNYGFVTAQTGFNAPSEWSGGEGGNYSYNSNFVQYVRDAQKGVNGKRGDGGSHYLDGPWGAIGCSNWNHGSDKSLTRLNNQGLKSDGYMELWYIGNLWQSKLKYVAPISTNTWDSTLTITKSELGI